MLETLSEVAEGKDTSSVARYSRAVVLLVVVASARAAKDGCSVSVKCDNMCADSWVPKYVPRNDLVATLMIIVLWNISIHQVQAACSRRECSESEGEFTKKVCQLRAKDIRDAEKTGNRSLVCQSVYELYVCVGENVPQCLGVISEAFQHYTYTPWECHFTDSQVDAIQALYNKGCVDIYSDNVTNKYQVQETEKVTTASDSTPRSDQTSHIHDVIVNDDVKINNSSSLLTESHKSDEAIISANNKASHAAHQIYKIQFPVTLTLIVLLKLWR